MSNSITRTYNFSNGGVADGGQVDSEIQNIVNTINNADAGTTAWTVINSATFKKSGTQILVPAQIVSATSTTDKSTTANTFQDTNLLATITPLATSSKILVLAMGWALVSNVATTINIQLFRGATGLFATTGGFAPAIANYFPVTFTWYDNPATIAATTYKISISSTDNVNAVHFGLQQSMILIEMAT